MSLLYQVTWELVEAMLRNLKVACYIAYFVITQVHYIEVWNYGGNIFTCLLCMLSLLSAALTCGSNVFTKSPYYACRWYHVGVMAYCRLEQVATHNIAWTLASHDFTYFLANLRQLSCTPRLAVFLSYFVTLLFLWHWVEPSKKKCHGPKLYHWDFTA